MVEELGKLQVIAVDCEGVNLSREGELCLVQIGTNNKVAFLVCSKEEKP